MRTSELTNEISAALSKAQGEMEVAPKDSVNPHFKSSYANLAACVRAARPALAKHGLCVIQSIEFNESSKIVGVLTRLSHQSGQYFEADTWCQPRSLAPQDIGSCATYLKRYGFSAMVGLITEEDDDGNAASGHTAQPASKATPTPRPPFQSAPEPRPAIKAANPHPTAPISAQEPSDLIPALPGGAGISELQRKRFFALAHKADWGENETKAYIEKAWGYKNIMLLDRKKYDHICGLLEKQVPFSDAWDRLIESLAARV